VVHALFPRGVAASLKRAGARAIITTDSCGRRPTAIPLAPLLAAALVSEIA
jgi:acyl-coenzyme A synthetase/AMP-(fatty) acid ligase